MHTARITQNLPEGMYYESERDRYRVRRQYAGIIYQDEVPGESPKQAFDLLEFLNGYIKRQRELHKKLRVSPKLFRKCRDATDILDSTHRARMRIRELREEQLGAPEQLELF